jgi:hypothetical protein
LVGVPADFMPSLRAAVAMAQQPFGTANGQDVPLYTLPNADGAECTITNYGDDLLDHLVTLKADRSALCFHFPAC